MNDANWNVAKIYKSDGSGSIATVQEATRRLEGGDGAYYRKGTVRNGMNFGEPFTLQTPFVYYEFTPLPQR